MAPESALEGEKGIPSPEVKPATPPADKILPQPKVEEPISGSSSITVIDENKNGKIEASGDAIRLEQDASNEVKETESKE